MIETYSNVIMVHMVYTIYTTLVPNCPKKVRGILQSMLLGEPNEQLSHYVEARIACFYLSLDHPRLYTQSTIHFDGQSTTPNVTLFMKRTMAFSLCLLTIKHINSNTTMPTLSKLTRVDNNLELILSCTLTHTMHNTLKEIGTN